MRIAIMGSGGVGGYFGARLVKGGADVTLHCPRRASRGDARRTASPSKARTSRSSCPRSTSPTIPRTIGPVDMVHVRRQAVGHRKRRALAAADHGPADRRSSRSRTACRRTTCCARSSAQTRVMGGVAYVATTIGAPGRDRADRHRCSAWCSANTTAAARRARRRSSRPAKRGGINAELSDDIRRAHLGEIRVPGRRCPAPRRRMRQHARADPRAIRRRAQFLLDLMREIVAVGRAHGVDLPADYAEQRLAFADGLPADMTSSMHHDLQARPAARGALAQRRRGRSRRRRPACRRR